MSGLFSRFDAHGLPTQIALYGIGLCLLGGSLAVGLRGTMSAWASVQPHLLAAATSPDSTAPAMAPTVESRVLSDESWAAQLLNPTFWSSRRSSGGGSSWTQTKSGLGFGAPDVIALPPVQQTTPGLPGAGNRNTFATMCVRLCDGFYFPVSHATTRDRFTEDDRKCKSSCGSDARLFVFRNAGGSPEDMQDLKGDSYSRLKTAFLYRTTYDAACKCRPHPWEQQAVDQHRVYALEAKLRKGDKQAATKLKALKADIAAGRTQTGRITAVSVQRTDALSPTRIAAAPAHTMIDGTRPATGILGAAASTAPAIPSQTPNFSPLRSASPGTSSVPPRSEPAVGARLAADGPPPGISPPARPVTTAALPTPLPASAGLADALLPDKPAQPPAKNAKRRDAGRVTLAPTPGLQPVVLINPAPTKTAAASRGDTWRRKIWSDR